MLRLTDIETELAERQNDLEAAAFAWFTAKREREQTEAMEFMRAEGSVEARRQQAKRISAAIGAEEEASWEGKRAVIRVLETRAMVGTAILKAQGRS
jgi:hypothetical protein